MAGNAVTRNPNVTKLNDGYGGKEHSLQKGIRRERIALVLKNEDSLLVTRDGVCTHRQLSLAVAIHALSKRVALCKLDIPKTD